MRPIIAQNATTVSGKQTLLRITLVPWPAPPLPVPQILVRSPVTLSENAVLDARAGVPRPVEVPEEFYLRELMDLRLSDAEAVRAFASQWGLLPQRDNPHDELGDTQTLGGFAFAARILRDEVRTWLWCKDQLTRIELLAAFELPEQSITFHHVQLGGDKQEALAYLAVHLNSSLAAFHVRLEVHGAALPMSEDLAAPAYTLGDVICLQLWNAIASDTDYRRCANKTCGRVFDKQRGGPGPRHRSDALYCSRSCARAQASRDWRKRRTDSRPKEDS